MVRRRVELRRIEDKVKRTASFSKRRNGLLKKARELAVLCDAEVGVIVFAPTGKLCCFSSHSSIETTIQRFHEFSDSGNNVEKCAGNNVKKCAPEGKSCCKGLSCQEFNNGIPEIAQRLSEQQNIVHLNEEEPDSLEKELDKALRKTTYRKREAPLEDSSKEGSVLNEQGTVWNNILSAEQPHHDSHHHSADNERCNGDHSGGDRPEAADTALGLWWPPHRNTPVDDRVEAAASRPHRTMLFL